MVSAPAKDRVPTRTAPRSSAGWTPANAPTGAGATAHYVTIRLGHGVTYLAGLVSGETMWVVVAPVPGLNRISSLDEGPTPGTSPLDGLPVYRYQLVWDSTGQALLSSACAMRTLNT